MTTAHDQWKPGQVMSGSIINPAMFELAKNNTSLPPRRLVSDVMTPMNGIGNDHATTSSSQTGQFLAGSACGSLAAAFLLFLPVAKNTAGSTAGHNEH
jgi:hypothetical protein